MLEEEDSIFEYTRDRGRYIKADGDFFMRQIENHLSDGRDPLDNLLLLLILSKTSLFSVFLKK